MKMPFQLIGQKIVLKTLLIDVYKRQLDDWALHIRRNYIEDTELKEDADDNAMTIEQYLHCLLYTSRCV